MNGFCITAQYPGYEQDITYIKLKNRNEQAQKREEAAAAELKAKNSYKNNQKTEQDYYSNMYQTQYSQFQYQTQYDPYYASQYNYGYDQTGGYQQQPQQQYIDYSQPAYNKTNYNQGNSEKYYQGKNNQGYDQNGGYYQQANTQFVNSEPEPPKQAEVKPTPAETSPVVQK